LWRLECSVWETCVRELDDWNMNFVATIIIPLKRQQDAWLDQCVRSAVSQDVACEVIVVRAGNTPPSNLAILESLGERWKNWTLVEEKPGSFPGAINLGIRCSTSGRIGLLLSDDWLDRDAVGQCLPLSADIVCNRPDHLPRKWRNDSGGGEPNSHHGGVRFPPHPFVESLRRRPGGS
jgi:glycosyltransferase involved in cell wall biosynthesis